MSNGPTENEKMFWSFRPLTRPLPPRVNQQDSAISPIDRFVLAALETKGLSLLQEADRPTLIRRLYLDLLGLPPTPREVSEFVSDSADNAYEKLVDRLLASPQYGERWARQWLDVVGYTDSNGYIRHDTPRPLAFRYRDYVIRSLNEDKPYDQFWQEQLAGDELVNCSEAAELSPQQLDTLIATHFLRNAPDGTDNSEGNETARVIERYAVLEGQLQITMSAMFGMTIECARCHSHKFDPIPQRDYYALQAVLYPAFNVRKWVQPKNRWTYAVGQNQIAAWKSANARIDNKIVEARREFEDWLSAHHQPGVLEWQDDFAGSGLAGKWSNTAPSDDTPAGIPAVRLDSSVAPAAQVEDGMLSVLPDSSSNSRWLVTKSSFDWTPNQIGDWIQITFDLVSSCGQQGNPKDRIGYCIALHDYDDSADAPTGNNNFDSPKGNILLNSDPNGGVEVTLDHPGKDEISIGKLGSRRYLPAHNFGIRITRLAKDEFLLQHLFEGQPETKTLRLTSGQLPNGGFGFELAGGCRFVVDDVKIESSTNSNPVMTQVEKLAFTKQVEEKSRQLTETITGLETHRPSEPERIAWVAELSGDAPEVHILKRGDYFQPGSAVEPGPLSVLTDDSNTMTVQPPASGAKSTGRRLAFSRWATHPNSRAAALLARVEVDRIWRGHFGRGLVLTPENFGASGVPPTHPELLEWLAVELAENGWHLKRLHRQIVLSRTYRQASNTSEAVTARDPENLLYGRFPAHRVDAEAIRDSMLAVAGVLNLKQFGPAVEFTESGNRQIVLPEPKGEGPHEVNRRSIYLRSRRSQPISFLQAFDQASPEPNCLARPTSTVVSQSLAMLNSEFAMRIGREFADRLEREAAASDPDRIRHAFHVALSREPTDNELARCVEFLTTQRALRVSQREKAPESVALADFCRMLLATNEFVYLE